MSQEGRGLKCWKLPLQFYEYSWFPSQTLEPAELFAVYDVDELTEKITSLPTGTEAGKLTTLSPQQWLSTNTQQYLNCRLL